MEHALRSGDDLVDGAAPRQGGAGLPRPRASRHGPAVGSRRSGRTQSSGIPLLRCSGAGRRRTRVTHSRRSGGSTTSKSSRSTRRRLRRICVVPFRSGHVPSLLLSERPRADARRCPVGTGIGARVGGVATDRRSSRCRGAPARRRRRTVGPGPVHGRDRVVSRIQEVADCLVWSLAQRALMAMDRDDWSGMLGQISPRRWGGDRPMSHGGLPHEPLGLRRRCPSRRARSRWRTCECAVDERYAHAGHGQHRPRRPGRSRSVSCSPRSHLALGEPVGARHLLREIDDVLRRRPRLGRLAGSTWRVSTRGWQPARGRGDHRRCHLRSCGWSRTSRRT